MASIVNRKNVGRFEDTATGRHVNVKKGRNKQRGTDHYFYMYRGSVVIIDDTDFHHNYKEVPNG